MAEQDSATSGTARPQASPASAPGGGQVPAAGGQLVPGSGPVPGSAIAPSAGDAAEVEAPQAAGPGAARPAERPAAPAREPSWGKVLATTVSLWTSRRLRRLTGQGRSGGEAAGGTTAGRRRSGIRWPLVALVLVLVIAALVGLQLSGVLGQHAKAGTGSSRPAPGASGAGGNGSGGNGALSAAAAARASAATWIAQQVTASGLISCDPLMCSALQADGVAASRLMSVQPTSTDPLGADVVAATSSVRSQFGSALVSEYAPQLLATFGTGASRVDVRAVANFGAAAFQTSEQRDLAARKAAGAQLLRKGLLPIGSSGASQIQAGQVDARILTTLAALLSQRPVDVFSFGATGPGAPILYRQVTVVDGPGQTGSGALLADLAQAQAQTGSYRPAHAGLVQLANGQPALRIEFGAPEPPGLLSGNP